MVAAPGEPADSTLTATGGVLVSRASRALRRSLTPLEWVVLEDVALDATEDDEGRLLAATSVRQVAERLGVSPGSAAKALSRLRSLGLVTHDRQPGPGGRFGLSLYRLVPPAGVDVVAAPGSPRTDSPRAASPRTAERHMPAREAGTDRKAAAATRPTRRVGPDQDHQQLDLLAPTSPSPAPSATLPSSPPTPTPTLPTNPTPPSSTPSSSTQTPTPTDTCQLFEQAAGRRRAERC